VARGAQTGDRVKVDFTGTIDGAEFAGGQARDFPITLGEARMLPEFEAAVTGMTAGETKSFSLTFPADWLLARATEPAVVLLTLTLSCPVPKQPPVRRSPPRWTVNPGEPTSPRKLRVSFDFDPSTRAVPAKTQSLASP